MDLLNNWQQELLGCFSSFLPSARVLFRFSVLQQGFRSGLCFAIRGWLFPAHRSKQNPRPWQVKLGGLFDSELPFGSWVYCWPCFPSEKEHGVGVKTPRMVIPYAQTFRKQGFSKGDALECL